MATMLGQPLMPWQRLVADVAGEYDPDTGVPCYRQVGVTIPRQQGKTSLMLCFQLNRCLSSRWEQPQRSVFTAQSGKDARDKWVDELFPLIRQSAVSKLVGQRGNRQQINEGIADTSIRFVTESVIRLLSTSTSSGHSKTLHQAVLDEIWHDEDDRREQGLRPAMVTIPDAQMLWCSTAGTEASLLYNRKRAAGRRSVERDVDAGMAYFEWSAPDDWDVDDEGSYFGFMPALCPAPPCRCGDGDGGWRHTVTLDVIRSERLDMDPSEFRRAYGNRSTQVQDLVVPADLWQRVCSPQVQPSGQVRFGLDVAPDRSSSAVAAYGGGTVELVRHGQGVGWVADFVNDLTSRHGTTVAVDVGGPAGSLVDDLEDVDRLQGSEVIHACAAMFDAIVDHKVTFRATVEDTDPFTAAVKGAVKRPIGDRWVWSRKASTADVTPLMAATLARSADDPPPPRVSAIY